tara:strand:- start:509 stop:1783 length:1275 start_codon:yes stop_codon:yes gene_type:complete
MKKKQVILTSIMGNALEFYDFTLYGVFAVVIAQLYFPSVDPLSAILASWGAFAAGFFMRPFGALIFGYLGDKFGRKKALSISIIGMGFPTLFIGFLPPYQQIGIAAPVLLILCRLIQGACTGGEYNGAAIFALEHIGKNKPGFFGGLITGSCVIGALLATALGALVTNSSNPEFFWRFTFIFGGAISLIGFYIRRRISESPEFLENQKSPNTTKAFSLVSVFKSHHKQLLISLMIGCLNGALSYTLFGFLNSYLKRYIGIPLENAMLFSLIGLTVFMISSPLFGLLMDKIGKTRYFMSATVGVCTLALMTFFMIQRADISSIIMAQVLLGLATGSIAGPQHAFVQNLFPVSIRYRAISFSFCLGMALCGGTAPLILTYLIETTQSLVMPAYFIATISALLFLSIASLKSSLTARTSTTPQLSSL